MERSIIISIGICTVVYVTLALSVAGALSIEEIIVAKDYALAAAAKPVFGNWGSILTIILAMVATISGVIASVYSASRFTTKFQLSFRIYYSLNATEKASSNQALLTIGSN